MKSRKWFANILSRLFGFESRIEKQHKLQRLYRPAFEQMEERVVPASYTWDGAGVLSITLLDNESLVINESLGSVAFDLTGGNFTQVSGTAAPDGDANTLLFATTDVDTSISITNLGVFAGTNDVSFSGAGSITTGAVDVDLTDADAVGTIAFSGGFDLTSDGAGGITLETVRNINIGIGSDIASDSGDIILRANFTTSTAGSFNGISIGGSISSTSGNITLEGHGGDGAGSGSNIGVTIHDSAIVGSGTTGTVSITGHGGGDNDSTDTSNFGVHVSNSTINSGGGNVLVTGEGGGSGTSTLNRGITLVNSTITSGGSGTVTVEGTGGTSSGTGNYGLKTLNSTITSSGGAVSVTAIAGNTVSEGLFMDSDFFLTASEISSGGTAALTIVTNSLHMVTPGENTIRGGLAGGAAVNIRQLTNGTLINLGGADVLSGSPLTLGLTDAELDRVFAGTLNIGNADTGTITVSSAIQHSGDANFNITTGKNISINFGSSWVSNNGNLVFSANQQVAPTTGFTQGILHSGSLRTTGAGNIELLGRGGSTLSSNGIFFNGSSITRAEGSGSVSATGVGFGSSSGIIVDDSSEISSAAASVTLTGTAGASANLALEAGISIQDDAVTISAGGASGIVSLITDSMIIGATNPTISAASGTVNLRQKTNTTVGINLGGADAANTLGLTDAELDRITAGTLNIGNANTGTITVSSLIDRSASTNITLSSGSDIVFNNEITTLGGTLGLSGNVKPQATPRDATASTVSFTSGSDLVITINGTTVNTDYAQLKGFAPGYEGSNPTGDDDGDGIQNSLDNAPNVANPTQTDTDLDGVGDAADPAPLDATYPNTTIDLTGVDLVVQGSFVPAANDVFTIVQAASRVGQFNGLPEGYQVIHNGLPLTVNYTSTSVTLTQVGATVTIGNDDNADSDFTIQVVGGNVQILRGATVVDSRPIAAYIGGTITIDGEDGFDDFLTVNADELNDAGFVGTIIFNGGTTGDDSLWVNTDSATVYSPDDTVFGNGVIDIDTGAFTIQFTGLEPVAFDFTTAAPFTLNLAGPDNNVFIDEGTLLASSDEALVLSGTTDGGTSIEEAHVRGATEIIIDSSSFSGSIDVVTIYKANNLHGNGALTIDTGADAGDTITVDGTTTFTGAVTLDAATINLNANVTNAVSGITATLINVGAPGPLQGQIQDAVNVAAATGATINVEAGTYVENVLVNKSVDILGANAGTAGNGTRVTESIIRTDGNQFAPAFPFGTTDAIFTVSASDVTISGFTIDGDDPSLAGAPLFNGTDANTFYGVQSVSGNDLTVSDNIIQNLFIGVRGDGTSNDNLITENWFKDIGAFDFGYGITLRDGYYADISDNLMERVYTGVHINNFSVANVPNTWSMSGNDITSYAAGLWFNQSYSTATPLSVTNNQFTAEASPVANNIGILVTNGPGAVGGTYTGNTITGHDYGVIVWGSDATVTLDGTNSIVDSQQAGVYVTNNIGFNPITGTALGLVATASTVVLDGISVTTTNSAADGVRARGDSGGGISTLTVQDDSTVSGGNTGILVVGPNATATIQNNDASIFGNTIGIDVNAGSASITGNSIYNNTTGIRATSGGTITALSSNTFDDPTAATEPDGDADNGTDLRIDSTAGTVTIGANNAFAGDTYYIDNQSSQTYNLVGTGNTFDATGVAPTADDNFRIEDRLFHALDSSTSGLIRYVAGNLYVTTPGTGASDETIQRALNAASNGDTINVEAGTFGENLTISKDVTLRGAQFGVDARGRSAAESIISATGTLVTLVTGSAGATIDGFTLQGGNRSIESTSGPLNNLQILNNRMLGFTGSGIFLNDSGTDITVHQNVVDGSSKIGSGNLVHLDTDNFNGFHLTNNNIVNGATATGFFVDGNHNVGESATRAALISGNLVSGNQTGLNLGQRAFGSLGTPSLGTYAGTISLNNITNNQFDGLQGGFQHVLVAQNSFTDNGRSGLALTSFGSSDATRGAQNSVVEQNFFSGNGAEDVFLSATQAVNTISTNTIVNNSFASIQGITYTGTETINASSNYWGISTASGLNAKISNEVQTVTVAATVTGGQFSLTFGSETTTNLNHNASAIDVQNALIALNAFAPGDIIVLDGGTPGVAYTIHFQGAFVRTNAAQIEANNVSLVGGGVTHATRANGVVSHTVDYTPWLNLGTEDPTTGTNAGFQGDFSSLHVDDNSPQFGGGGRITEAIGLLADGSLTGSNRIVQVEDGTYAENIDATGKALTLHLGASPGQVTVNSLILNSDDIYAVDIDGYVAGTGYDQLIVAGSAPGGTVSLGGAKLIVNETLLDPVILGSVFRIISNNDSDAVTGVFDLSTYPAPTSPVYTDGGTRIVINGHIYEVFYNFGTAPGNGNDVVLRLDQNDAPIVSVPGTQATFEDTSLTFSSTNGNAITVADTDAGTAIIQLKLLVSNGTLTLGTTAGLSFSFSDPNGTGTGDGTADATMVFRGTVAQINAALEGLVYTPNSNFSNNDTLQITANDLGNTGPGGVKIGLGAVVISVFNVDNDAPTVPNRSFTFNEDTSLSGTLTGTDPEGSALTFTVLSGPSFGTFNYDSNTGAFTYSPNANYNGSDSFTYRAFDGVNNSNVGTVTLNITPINDAPTASNLSAPETYLEDTPLNLTDIVVSDIDSANVTVTLTLSNPGAGSLNTDTSGAVTSTYVAGTGIWSASGAIADVNTLLAALTFTPTTNLNGNFTIATSVSDGAAPAITGLKSVTGVSVNDEPSADTDSYNVNEDETLVVLAANGVLNGDTDPNDTPPNTLSATLITNVSNGLLLLNNDGSFTYSPNADFNGIDTFQYQVRDDGGTANGGVNVGNTVTVTINVGAVNDAPTATNLNAPETYIEDTPLNLTDIVISDIDSATVTATLTLSNPLAGSLNTGTSGLVTSTYISGTGVWTASGAIANVNALLAGLTFTPASNFDDNFTIATSVSDGVAPAITGSKAITGVSVNDEPVADTDSYNVNEDETLVVLAANGVLNGDTDPNDTPPNTLSATLITNVSNGSLFFATDGSFTYTPNANFHGIDTFQYQVKDDGGTANGGDNIGNTVLVTITVDSVNDAPAGTDNTVTTDEDIAYTFTAADFGFSDVNDSPANNFNRVKITTTPGVGVLTLVGFPVNPGNFATKAQIDAGDLKFNPAPQGNGSPYTSFTFQVEDDGGGSNLDPTPNTITINVTPVNDAPVLAVTSIVNYTENDAATAINTNITVADLDNATLASATITLTTFVAGQDVLAFVNDGSTMGNIAVASNAGGILTLTSAGATATLVQWQNALHAVTYQNTSELPTTTPRNVSFLVNDGADDSNIINSTINVASINDTPVNAVPAGTQTTNVNTPLVFSSISTSDVDANGATVQVTISVNQGTLTLSGTSGLSFSFTDGNGTGQGDGTADATMTFRGTILNINAALNGLTYQPTLNYSGADSLTITTNDLGNTGTPGAQIDSDVINLSVQQAFQDNFNRADSATLGANWTNHLGAFGISSNQARVNTVDSTSNGALATINGISLADVVLQAEVDVNSTLSPSAFSGLVARHSGPGLTAAYWGGLERSGDAVFARIYRRSGGIWQLLGSQQVASSSGVLRFELINDSLKLFLNGELVTFAFDTAITAAGNGGLWASQDSRIDNFSIVPHDPLTNATLPHTDDFDAANQTQLDSDWRELSGNFTVLGNQLSAKGTTNFAILNGVSQANVDVQAEFNASSFDTGYAGLVARHSGPGDTNMYWAGLERSGGDTFARIYKNIGGIWTQLASQDIALASGTLRFEVINDSLKLFVNGSLVAFAIDSSIAGPGTVGIRTFEGATVNNFSAAVHPSLSNAPFPYSDDFTGANGAQLNSNWRELAGNYTVQGNLLTSVGEKNFAVLNGVSQTNVDVQAEINATIFDTGYAGLVARHSGPGDTNMYWAGLERSGGDTFARIYKNIGGVWTLLATQDLALASGTLRFEVINDSLKLFVNGNLVAFAFDSSIAGPGTVGVRTFEGTTIDNFSATAHPPLSNAPFPYTDSFTAANGAQLNSNWRELTGNYTVQGNLLMSVGEKNFAVLNGISQTNVNVQADFNVIDVETGYAGLVARHSGPGDTNMYWAGLERSGGSTFARIYKNIGGVWTLLSSQSTAITSGTLQFELINDSLKLFINNALATFAFDSSITGPGTVGIRSSLDATVDIFSASIHPPLNTVNLAFNDDFTGADGTQLSDDWREVSGNFGVQGNQLSANGNITNNLAVLNGLSTGNAIVTADITFSAINQNAGLVGRYSGPGDTNLYLANLIYQGGTTVQATLHKNVGGVWTSLGTTTVTNFAGELGLQMNGTTIDLLVDGIAVVSVTDNSLTTGSVGIRAGVGVLIDNFAAN